MGPSPTAPTRVLSHRTGYDVCTMKKLILTALFALGLGIAVIAPTEKPADAQVTYCGHCCGTDPYGNAVIGCTLIAAAPCGNACTCSNVPGVGFCCY